MQLVFFSYKLYSSQQSQAWFLEQTTLILYILAALGNILGYSLFEQIGEETKNKVDFGT